MLPATPFLRLSSTRDLQEEAGPELSQAFFFFIHHEDSSSSLS